MTRSEAVGLLLGLAGVAMFSLTLPMTRLAVAELDATWVGMARALFAVVPAGLWLWWQGHHRLPEGSLRPLLVSAAGTVVGFPTLTSIAMGQVDASHGAVMLGILPLATALAATFVAGERPSRAFWLSAVIGAALVVGFALRAGGGRLQAADLLLVGAVIAGAIGYAEGARLSRRIGGPATICWALVVGAPFLVAPVAWLAWRHGLQASPRAWLGFAYVSLFSQLLGFFAWYKAMVIGGIARVSQLQLLQIFMTLGFASLLAGETPGLEAWVFGVLVVAVVAIGQRTRVAAPTGR